MRKGERRKEKILQIAENLFFSKGYQKTSLNDILAEVGCSKGSFYHHFDSKIGLLWETANRRIISAYKNFEAEEAEGGIHRLNAMLYHASSLGKSEAPFLSVLLSLRLRSEGAELFDQLRRARKALYLPELRETLHAMALSEEAGFAGGALTELLWDSHAAFIETVMEKVCKLAMTEEAPGSSLTDLLRVARFHWERMLDLPYGSVVIIEAPELLATFQSATAALVSGGKRADTSAPCQSFRGRV